MIPRSINDDPCLLNTHQFFSYNVEEDYENLVNHVHRHMKCSVDSCLRNKGLILCYQCEAPWEVHANSSLYIDGKGEKNVDLLRTMSV